MDGSIRVEMFGVKLPPGKAAEVGTEDSNLLVETVQITQVSLGDKPKEGRHTVWCEANGVKWVMGALIPGQIEQFQTDYMGRHSIKLSNTGPSDVYVSGFKTLTMLDDDEDGFEEEDDEDEDEEDEDEDDKAPVALQNGKPPKLQKAPVAAAPAADEDDDEESSDEDDDEEDDEEGDEEDEEEDEEGVELEAAEFSDTDDDDEEDEDEEDDEDEDEDDEEEEEEEPKKPQGKHITPVPVQPPAKKAKADTKQSSKESGEATDYEKALKDYLRKEGATPLSTLGSKVKKPASLGSIKIKKFLESRPKLFKVDAGLNVSLA